MDAEIKKIKKYIKIQDELENWNIWEIKGTSGSFYKIETRNIKKKIHKKNVIIDNGTSLFIDNIDKINIENNINDSVNLRTARIPSKCWDCQWRKQWNDSSICGLKWIDVCYDKKDNNHYEDCWFNTNDWNEIGTYYKDGISIEEIRKEDWEV